VSALTSTERPVDVARGLALERAQAHRARRRDVRRELRGLDRRAGLRRAVELVRDVPPELASLPMEQLVMWCRWIGPQRAARICWRAFGHQVPSRPLGELTARERGALEMALLLEAS